MLVTFWRREKVQEETLRSDRDVKLEEIFSTVCSALDETFSSLQRSALLSDIFLNDLRSSKDLRFKRNGAGVYIKQGEPVSPDLLVMLSLAHVIKMVAYHIWSDE